MADEKGELSAVSHLLLTFLGHKSMYRISCHAVPRIRDQHLGQGDLEEILRQDQHMAPNTRIENSRKFNMTISIQFSNLEGHGK